jgi:hypothetical protein
MAYLFNPHLYSNTTLKSYKYTFRYSLFYVILI